LWSGGNFRNPVEYISRKIFEATTNILDFTADKNGNLYLLFSDSVIVLDTGGKYTTKIEVENLAPGSRIISNSAGNTLYLFDKLKNSVRILSQSKTKTTGEIVTLEKNIPNPVDNFTEIQFTLSEPLDVILTVYNLIGEPVKVIARDYYPEGIHRIIWNITDEKGNLVPNGVYFYRLETKKGVAIRQLIVLR
jgi:hypothetical protein